MAVAAAASAGVRSALAITDVTERDQSHSDRVLLILLKRGNYEFSIPTWELYS